MLLNSRKFQVGVDHCPSNNNIHLHLEDGQASLLYCLARINYACLMHFPEMGVGWNLSLGLLTMGTPNLVLLEALLLLRCVGGRHASQNSSKTVYYNNTHLQLHAGKSIGSFIPSPSIWLQKIC